MDLAPAKADFQGRGGVMMAAHGSDAGLHVEFRNEAIHMTFESEKQGRPIYQDVPFIVISYPGDKTRRTERKATEEDQRRFPRQWDAFQRNEATPLEGTPLKEWALLTRSQIAELQAVNIHTVEQLANIPDTSLNMLGLRDLRKQACSYLAQARDGAEVSRLAQENTSLREEIDLMKEQIEVLAANQKTEKGTKA